MCVCSVEEASESLGLMLPDSVIAAVVLYMIVNMTVNVTLNMIVATAAAAAAAYSVSRIDDGQLTAERGRRRSNRRMCEGLRRGCMGGKGGS